MKVYFQDDRAFVQASKTHMICIGSKTDVEKATDLEICKMVYEAIAWNQYFSIERGKGLTIN